MGGLGSGRRWQWSAKSATTEFHSLDIRRWSREGFLEPGRSFGWQWYRNGEAIGDIRVSIDCAGARLRYRAREAGGDWESMDYTVHFLTQQCNYGGSRKWFSCPVSGCGRRVAILYGGRVFACRHCHQLAYPSQREENFQRAARRGERIRQRLGWAHGAEFGPRPKGMHRATYERLLEELDYWDKMETIGFMDRYQHLLSRHNRT